MDEVELLRRLREAFAIESAERLDSLSSHLIKLEDGKDASGFQKTLEIVYREAHSLKGAARAVNLIDIEAVCQAMESVFGCLKREELLPSTPLFDVLQQSLNFVQSIVDDVDKSVDQDQLLELIRQLTAAEKDELKELNKTIEIQPEAPCQIPEESALPAVDSPVKKNESETIKPVVATVQSEPAKLQNPPEESTPNPFHAVTLRIATEKLDAMFHKTEEMVSLKLQAEQDVKELQKVIDSLGKWRKKWKQMEPLLQKLQRYVERSQKRKEEHAMHTDYGNVFNWQQEMITTLDRDIRALAVKAKENQRSLNLRVDELLDEVKNVVMLPGSTLLDSFPRMIRDIARASDKKISFNVVGGTIEIDRRVLEEMKDPLLHLLRNAIDHGIETESERLAKGKDPCGKIQCTLSTVDGNNVEIVLEDDGAGIDPEAIGSAAVQKGVIRESDTKNMTDEELQNLIFHSGMSTAKIITNLSGRGLGMAIVKEQVEKLNGKMTFRSVLGEGSSFTIRLPISLSTLRGVTVRVGHAVFAIPSGQVEMVFQTSVDRIKTVEGQTILSVNGKPLSLVSLAEVLGVQKSHSAVATELFNVAILGIGEKHIGFEVDEIIGEHEILVRDLGKQLRHVPNISGATILGDGRVVPVLNVHDLLRSASGGGLVQRAVQTEASVESREQKNILVVEDSITSRMLLKNILEAAGFVVVTAVDGLDGLTTLKTTDIDLVVSDVEMPRMNGFEMTESIRSDEKYADLPLILCTSLASREDRERGVEVGANAYIMKSSFDQSDLLDVIARFI